MADLLTAAEAARRLGVKPATLYAYVSRGVLSRGKAADGRASLFHADEVERLARRGRPRRPPGVADITVESAITEIAGDRLRFRGQDVARLAVSRTFEEVAELLWTGELRSAREAWQARPAALAAGRAAQAALPAGTLLAAASGPDDVPRVVGRIAATGREGAWLRSFRVPRNGDPRAVVLLDLVRRAAPKSGQLAVADAVLAEVRQKSLPEPNIDFAIATLARVAGMVRGAGEAIFAVARTAGWIAHALEAYAGPGPLRPRAVYTGKPAADDP